MGCSKSKAVQGQVAGQQGAAGPSGPSGPSVTLAIYCESGVPDEILQVVVPQGSKISEVKRQLQDMYGLPAATASLSLSPDSPPLSDDSALESGVELLHYITPDGMVGDQIDLQLEDLVAQMGGAMQEAAAAQNGAAMEALAGLQLQIDFYRGEDLVLSGLYEATMLVGELAQLVAMEISLDSCMLLSGMPLPLDSPIGLFCEEEVNKLQVLAPGEGPLGPLGEEGLPSGAEEGPVRTMF
jgi:hypothetical protein